MAKRTPEEVRAQREAWLARKAAREAGEEVPAVTPDSSAEPQPEQAAQAESAPSQPARKRTPEEVKAQREAFLARKAAREAGQPAPAPEAEKGAAPAPSARAEKPAAAAKPKSAPQPKKPKTVSPPASAAPANGADASVITRRELLNYAWLASIGLFAVETVGLSLWFAFPNFQEGEFGGAFAIGQAAGVLPPVNGAPQAFTDGKFWLVNLDTEGPDGEPKQGILAIYKVCTHLGCLYDWIPMTSRFECPCHGSKFALTGDYLEGPARRSLDRFVIQAVSPDGAVKQTNPDGEPLVIDGDEELIIDTGQRILGEPTEAA